MKIIISKSQKRTNSLSFLNRFKGKINKVDRLGELTAIQDNLSKKCLKKPKNRQETENCQYKVKYNSQHHRVQTEAISESNYQVNPLDRVYVNGFPSLKTKYIDQKQNIDPNFNFSFFQRKEEDYKGEKQINVNQNGEIFDELKFNSIVLPKIQALPRMMQNNQRNGSKMKKLERMRMKIIQNKSLLMR